MKEMKPWGYTIKPFGLPWLWVKYISVEPGKQNSLHYHQSRRELVWKLPCTFYTVAKNKPHRLITGSYVEIAVGRPDENDVVRIEDDYGRA